MKFKFNLDKYSLLNLEIYISSRKEHFILIMFREDIVDLLLYKMLLNKFKLYSQTLYLYLINMLVTTFFSNLINYYLINKQKRIQDSRFPLNFISICFIFLNIFYHRQDYKLSKRYQIEYMNFPAIQAQANLYYQNMQIDLSNKYGNIYGFVLFSVGDCSILPL